MEKEIPGNLRHYLLQLPGDLLDDVANNLNLDDCVRCRCVCVSWRKFFSEVVAKKKKYRLLLPFLLIAPPHSEVSFKYQHRLPDEEDGVVNALVPREKSDYNIDDKHQTRRLYSLSSKKVYKFEVQVPPTKRCRGSCFGWLITMEETDVNHFCVQLCNPFLPNDRIINLPSLDNIVENDKSSYRPDLYLIKAVLSNSPTNNNNYAMLAIVASCSMLAFVRPADKAWTPIECKQEFRDVIYYNKTQEFYAVDDTGAVFAIDMGGGDDIPRLTQVAPPTERDWVSERYLVESTSGDLLQVLKLCNNIKREEEDDLTMPQFMTAIFEVLRLDLNRRSWIEIDNVGDNALFIGDSCSISLSASNVPGCKPNSIYFTDKQIFSDYMQVFGPEHNGIYDMEDRTIRPHYPMVRKEIYPVPIWLEPTLQDH